MPNDEQTTTDPRLGECGAQCAGYECALPRWHRGNHQALTAVRDPADRGQVVVVVRVQRRERIGSHFDASWIVYGLRGQTLIHIPEGTPYCPECVADAEVDE